MAGLPPHSPPSVAPRLRAPSARWPERLAALAAATAIALPAAALEGDFLTYTVGGTVSYDDNLLRLPDRVSPAQVGVGARSRGTWIGYAFARVGFDLPVSRQRFRGFVQGNAYRFDDYSYLNWQGIDYNLSWLWEAGNRWNGTLSAERLEFLTGLADFRALTQNLRTAQTLQGSAEFALHPRWRLTSAITALELRNSSNLLAITDLDQYSASAGFKYLSTAQNFLIFGARYTRGDYPQRATPTFFADNRFDQYDAGVQLSWGLGGNAEIAGSLGYTRRDLPNLPQRGFSGLTGDLRLNWRTSGKTGVEASLARTIGAIEDVAANFIVRDAISIGPYWLPTSKLRVQAAYLYDKASFAGQAIVVPGLLPERQDRTHSVRVGTAWTATRNWQLGLNYVYSTRSSNFPNQDFTDNTVSATVRFSW